MISPIVNADWLRGRLDSVIVCDVRTTMNDDAPRASYEAGHLPGARYVSLDDDLADPPVAVLGRHPLPTSERFAEVVGLLGIGDSDVVVAYDLAAGGHAARLVWMLRVTGTDAALLDGGLAQWDGPLETGPADCDPVDRSVVPWPAEAIADGDEVARHLAASGVVVDSREVARFAGEVEPIDAVAGHIPGAINLPFGANLADGRFRDPALLRRRFEPLADDPRAIVYCGSGVTACHNALAIEHAGLPRPRVYVGSWSGWSTDPEREVATGSG